MRPLLCHKSGDNRSKPSAANAGINAHHQLRRRRTGAGSGSGHSARFGGDGAHQPIFAARRRLRTAAAQGQAIQDRRATPAIRGGRRHRSPGAAPAPGDRRRSVHPARRAPDRPRIVRASSIISGLKQLLPTRSRLSAVAEPLDAQRARRWPNQLRLQLRCYSTFSQTQRPLKRFQPTTLLKLSFIPQTWPANTAAHCESWS